MRSPTLLMSVILVACVGDAPSALDGGDKPDSGMMPTDGGTPADSGPLDAQLPPADVNVTVVDGLGSSVANVNVQIGTSTCMTNAQGKCTIAAVGPTYDLTMAYDAPIVSVNTKRVTAFLGLTTRTPTLEAISAAVRKTSFTVNVTGATFPLPANDVVRVLYAPTSNSSDVSLQMSPNNAQTMFQSWTWNGQTPNKGSVYGYQLTLANGLPSVWKSQSTPASYTFADTATLVQAMALTAGPPATAPVGGALNASGTAVSTLMLYVTPNGGGNGRLAFINASAGTTFNVPVLTASTVNVAYGGITNGRAVWVWKANVTPNTTNLQLTIPASLTTLQMPAANVMGVDGTTSFAWTGPFSTSLFRVFCPPQNTPYTYVYEVLTTGTSAQIPNTSGLGAPLPGGASCVWQVVNFAGAKTPDDFVQPAGWTRFTSQSTFTQDGAASTDGRPFTMK